MADKDWWLISWPSTRMIKICNSFFIRKINILDFYQFYYLIIYFYSIICLFYHFHHYISCYKNQTEIVLLLYDTQFGGVIIQLDCAISIFKRNTDILNLYLKSETILFKHCPSKKVQNTFPLYIYIYIYIYISLSVQCFCKGKNMTFYFFIHV